MSSIRSTVAIVRARWLAPVLFACTVTFTCAGSVLRADEVPLWESPPLAARDTLSIDGEMSADARECLRGLAWEPGEFAVSFQKPVGSEDVLLRFASPIETGDARNDLVAMEWYRARQEDAAADAPAVVVIHESGRGMTVGRLLAKAFAQQGIHAFLLQLPSYGERRHDVDAASSNILVLMRQGIADVRRSYDAVAVLPGVDRERIALQGTSLGAIVSATAGSLDACYESVFLLMGGGDLYEMIKTGERDTANVRRKLEEMGVTDERLRQMAWAIEPTRIAHRLKAERTWLYSGTKDTVVPPRHAQVLAESAGLDAQHHVQLNADHYSGTIYLPIIITHIAGEIHGRAVLPPAP
jgi:dienelactone hydrolase